VKDNAFSLRGRVFTLMFTRLASLSQSRSYSTGPNKAIIDLLKQCRRAPYRSHHDTHLGHCPGLKEEDSSPSRNAYKIRSFQSAIATIHEHKKHIRSGKEAIKVRHLYHRLGPYFHAAAAAWYRTRHCKPNRLFSAGQRICL